MTAFIFAKKVEGRKKERKKDKKERKNIRKKGQEEEEEYLSQKISMEFGLTLWSPKGKQGVVN